MFSEVPETFEFEWKVENVFLESETIRPMDSPVFRIGFLDQSTWFIRLLPSQNRSRCEWHRCENDAVISKKRTFKVSIQVQIRQFNSGAILEEWFNPELKIDSETSQILFEEEYAKELHPPSPQIGTLTVLFLVRDLTLHENSSTRFNTPQIQISSMADLSLSWIDSYGRPSSFLPESSSCFSRTDTMQKTVNWTMDKMGHGESRVVYLEPANRNVSALQMSVTNEYGKLYITVEKTLDDCQTASVLQVVVEWAADPEYFKVSCRFDEQHTSHRFDTRIQLNSIKDDSFQLKMDIKEVKDGECYPNKCTRFLTRRPSSGTNVTREIREDMLKMYREKIGIDVKLRASCGKVFYGHRDFLVSRSSKFEALLQADVLNQKQSVSSCLEENNMLHVPDERDIVENYAENKWEVDKNQNILKSNVIDADNDQHDAKENRLTLDVVQELSEDSVEVNALESPLKEIPLTNFKQGKEMSKNSKENQESEKPSLKEKDIPKKGLESETLDPDVVISGKKIVSNASYVQESNNDHHKINFFSTMKMCDNIDTLNSATTNYSLEDCTLSENEMCRPNDFKQNLVSESTTLDILDLDAKTLDHLLIFLYSASLEEELELCTLLKIYEAANLYHVPALQDLCRRRLEQVRGHVMDKT